MDEVRLNETEKRALAELAAGGGALLVTSIPDKNERDLVLGDVRPGHTIYRRLERAGMCFYAEPVVTEDGFEFTPEVYLMAEGKAALEMEPLRC